jgi:steroid 5-alpha reductase family enzyme
MLLPNTTPGSLPLITSIADCADFSKTVEAYIPQLYTFPNAFANAIGDANALKHLYLTTNPMISSTVFSIATFPIFFIVSEINKNYSQVDRVWSILPTIYHIHYSIWAHMNGLPTSRVDNVLAFSVLWSIRLTFNYWRRGGYQVGSEDYRWKIIEKRIGNIGFVLLNIVFISTTQIVRLNLPISQPHH